VVVDDSFDWGGDRGVRFPWHETVIYQAHVRGFTKQRMDIPEQQRGTFAAMGSPSVISYLKDLGVTTLLLMTVNHFVSGRELVQRGLSNYWGYDPIGYFAPEASYSSAGAAGEQVREFKKMVRALHVAGIEVILDMAYSHTAEGDESGPHLCFRGVDNRAYYRLKDDKRYYEDYSGCGNSLNLNEVHQRGLRLIVDSLRYWATEMHVDGFRLDLASAVARNLYEAGTLVSRVVSV
jgi:isoamylase